MASISNVPFVNKTQRVVHCQRASNINCSTVVVFLILVSAVFHNQSPLLSLIVGDVLVNLLMRFSACTLCV